MRKLLLITAALTLILCSSCRTKYIVTEKEVPVETVRVEYKTNTKMDSIYIHDSINVYTKGDTVFKDKIKLVYKDRLITDTVHKVDSIEKPIYITKTEIQEVKKTSKLQSFLGWSGLLAWLVAVFFLTRFILIKTNKLKL